uniref:Uncharacterized protein n=1 Tax=Brassica campestris TaxID=3711 RepID=A0A3P6BFZ6_BRACM|nr:unnamed protein product [Brassica rapa]
MSSTPRLSLYFRYRYSSSQPLSTPLLSLSPTPSPTISPVPRTSPTPPRTSSTSPLDPKQLKAFESLNIPTLKNPCDHHHPSSSKKPPTTVRTSDTHCSPFRLVTSLSFTNCSSSDLSISSTALKALSPPSPPSLSTTALPSPLPPPPSWTSLHSFSRVSSFPPASRDSPSLRLVNLTDITVSSVPVSTSGLFVILGNMHDIVSLTISHANLSGNTSQNPSTRISHSSTYPIISSKDQYPLRLLSSPALQEKCL